MASIIPYCHTSVAAWKTKSADGGAETDKTVRMLGPRVAVREVFMILVASQMDTLIAAAADVEETALTVILSTRKALLGGKLDSEFAIVNDWELPTPSENENDST